MTRLIPLAAGLAAALSFPSMAQMRVALAPPASGDVAPRHLAGRAVPTPPSVETEPVQFAWPIDASTPLARPAPYEAESREFWATVDGAALARGYRVHTTGPAAVVRISAEPGAATPAFSTLQVLHGGRTLSAQAASTARADAAQLEAAGAPFPDRTLALQLRPDLGAGAFDLRMAEARGRYLVHVFEPESPYALHLATPETAHLTGDRVRLEARLRTPASGVSLQRIGALLTAPDGRTVPAEFRREGDAWRAEVALPPDASAVPGLWELHAFAVGRAAAQPLLRDAKLALAVAAPTARLGRAAAVEPAPDGLRFAVPVEAAVEGRYEVRGVLYGTSATGELVPAAVGHSAARLEAGTGALELHFEPALLAGLSAPYELRDLELSDQGRNGRLERRALGLRLSR
ncbi:DUF4785 domain-containing protein [Coralloluteibacterium thermophilus]|uniref:DUF4785 domain-containing protein n=1 Tax=Coralloluteibacterium thermophilum TaxID=2707049 RepID=A0ABV9NQ59_9GAMM